MKEDIFPDFERASSLYKRMGATYFDSLDKKDIKNKIQVMKRAP